MKTKPGGRAARTDLPPEIPEELKALDDAALLDALETQPPAVATRALHERLRKRPAPSDAFKSGARVLLARIVFRTPSSHAATAAAAYGFSGPDGALLLEALRSALEKTSSSNAFTNAAARALVATDADAYQREEWPLSAKVALVHAASKTLRNADAASQICADASRTADDDVTRAAALDALTALAKRAQSCRSIAADAASTALRRPLDRRRFAAAVAGRRPPLLFVACADVSAVLQGSRLRILRLGSAIGHFQNTHQTNQPWHQSLGERRLAAAGRLFPSTAFFEPWSRTRVEPRGSPGIRHLESEVYRAWCEINQ